MSFLGSFHGRVSPQRSQSAMAASASAGWKERIRIGAAATSGREALAQRLAHPPAARWRLA